MLRKLKNKKEEKIVGKSIFKIAKTQTTIGLLVGLVIAITGCVAVPKIEQKEIIVTAPATQKVNNESWWQAFQDPYLNQLINTVYANNSDLSLAAINLQKALENTNLAKVQSTPNYSVDYSFEREKLSKVGLVVPPYGGAIINQNNLAFSMDYSIDYLGKFDALIKSKQYLEEGEILKANYLKLTLSTQTTKLYAYAQYLKNKSDLLQKQNSLLKNLAENEKEKVKLGTSIKENILNINNQISLNNNLIEQYDNTYKTSINSIYKLIGGLNPKPFNIANKEIYQKPLQPLVKQIKANSLASRPDIAYYLKLFNSGKSNLQYLKAGFYPNITLSGSVGYQSIPISYLLQAQAFAWNFGPAINIPIFNQGNLKGNYLLAGLDMNQAIEQYNQALSNAFYDVNNKLLTNKTDFNNLQNQKNVYTNNQQTWTDAQDRFSLGTISKDQLLQNQFNYIQAQSDLLDSQWQYFSSNVDVIEAIGGIIPNEEKLYGNK